MTRKKESPTASLVRSSAAEYLTFVAARGGGGVEAVYDDENVWLSQKMMAQLYDVEVPTINYHLKKVFADSELEENSVIRNFRITAADGERIEPRHIACLAATSNCSTLPISSNQPPCVISVGPTVRRSRIVRLGGKCSRIRRALGLDKKGCTRAARWKRRAVWLAWGGPR